MACFAKASVIVSAQEVRPSKQTQKKRQAVGLVCNIWYATHHMLHVLTHAQRRSWQGVASNSSCSHLVQQTLQMESGEGTTRARASVLAFTCTAST